MTTMVVSEHLMFLSNGEQCGIYDQQAWLRGSAGPTTGTTSKLSPCVSGPHNVEFREASNHYPKEGGETLVKGPSEADAVDVVQAKYLESENGGETTA